MAINDFNLVYFNAITGKTCYQLQIGGSMIRALCAAHYHIKATPKCKVVFEQNFLLLQLAGHSWFT